MLIYYRGGRLSHYKRTLFKALEKTKINFITEQEEFLKKTDKRSEQAK